MRAHVTDRRGQLEVDPALKGMRWILLSDRSCRNPRLQAELDELLAHVVTKAIVRTRGLFLHWCTNVLRSKVES